jgi:hypothetical protein
LIYLSSGEEMYLANAQLHDELADLLGAGIGSTLTRNGIFMSSVRLGRLCVLHVGGGEREREREERVRESEREAQ